MTHPSSVLAALKVKSSVLPPCLHLKWGLQVGLRAARLNQPLLEPCRAPGACAADVHSAWHLTAPHPHLPSSHHLCGWKNRACLSALAEEVQELQRNNTFRFPYSIIGINVGEKPKTECLKVYSAWEALEPKWVLQLNHPTIISLNCCVRMRVTSLGTLHNKKSILRLIFSSFPCRESVWDCISSRLAFNC